ncbi:MAG: DUF2997 domain-containing protein [Planctomycetaceae bacterium]|nr:DUF2997 domain-containing protein [Planctomycetaceae bacterium]
MNRVIEIIVAPDGSTRLQTRGFQGGTCLEASRFLEDALGDKASDERTPEFYLPVDQPETVRQERQA